MTTTTTYEQLLDRIISDGIAEVRTAYADPKDHHKRDGAIEGFEACRGKSPIELVDLWKEVQGKCFMARSASLLDDLGRLRTGRWTAATHAPTNRARRDEVRLHRRREQRRGRPVTEVFVLMADGDGTMRSSDEPIGVAVTTKEEADRYVKEGGVGYTHSYVKLVIFDNKDDALRHLYPNSRKFK
jgi:hypothetical protein